MISLLRELRERASRMAVSDGSLAEFAVRQNAEVLAGAERYYRAMLDSGPESWNIRDHHMADTLDRLMQHHGPDAKAVVWAHNTHIGDARATDMADIGEINIGQLVRERHIGEGVVLVGFGSHSGTVIAAGRRAPDHGGPARTRRQPGGPAAPRAAGRPGAVRLSARAVQFQRPPTTGLGEWFHQERGHRAIGVVYRPQFERVGNYVPTVLAQRYDAFCHLDRTHALTPLHPLSAERLEEQTWPVGV